MLIRIIFVFLTLGCIGSAAQASTLSTVCAVSFIPESGGPGTLVRIEVSQCYSGAPFFLQPGLSVPYSGNDVGPPTFRPIGKPLAGVNLPGDAYFSTTITIPARLPDGSRITNRGLTLRVTDKYGNDIAEGGLSTFTVTDSALPQTGYSNNFGWIGAFMALAALFVGGFLRRKMAG